MQIGVSAPISSSWTHFFSASALSKIRQSPHQPAMPSTSGWVGVPMMTGSLPSASAWLTRPWMRLTKGHVASMISAPVLSSRLYTSRLTPWERITTVSPGPASSGESMTRTPAAANCSTTWRLWMMGPRVSVRFPSAAACCTSSTARLTPKQKPALLATRTLIGPLSPR